MSSDSDKAVLITGGARRVGAQLARAFAAAGWRVVIHCHRSREAADALAAEIGGAVIEYDLRTAESSEVISAAAACFGRLDAVINNASAYRRRHFDCATEEQLREDFEINFFAPFALMRAFAAAHRGAIINILDSRIARVDVDAAGYALAKQSLAEATRLGALAWASRGISVNGIAPGFIRPADGVPLSKMTPFLAAVPSGERTTEESIASAALFLAVTPGITGEILYIDGGWHLPSAALGERIP